MLRSLSPGLEYGATIFSLSSDHTEFPFSVIVTEKTSDFSVTMTVSGLKPPFWAIVPQKLPDFSVTMCTRFLTTVQSCSKPLTM